MTAACFVRAAVPVVLLSVVACHGARPGIPERTFDAEQVVTLDLVRDGAQDIRAGLTNIFFEPFPDSLRARARVGADWAELAVVDVVGNGSIRPVMLARFRVPGEDSLWYVLDTAGALDFLRGRPLAFRRQGQLRVADVPLTVTAVTGEKIRRPYQVLLADDGYSYARIAESRAGGIHAGGATYAVRVRSRSRGEPFLTLGRGTVIFADLDGDGTISELPSVTAGGRPMSPEELTPGAPFTLGGELLEVTAVDSAGTELWVRRSAREVAAVQGLRVPELDAALLDGGSIRLSQEKGRVVLVEFWATDCAFSEKVREPLNALATRTDGKPFTWLAVAKDRSADSLRHLLATHPMRARVALAEGAAWTEFNPVGVTPLFVLVDANGVVRARASGATAVDRIVRATEELLAATTPASASAATAHARQGQERTVFNDSLLHVERCAPPEAGQDWRRVCTPIDQRNQRVRPLSPPPRR